MLILKCNFLKKAIKVKTEDYDISIEDEATLVSEFAVTWICKKREDGIYAAIKEGAKLRGHSNGSNDHLQCGSNHTFRSPKASQVHYIIAL